MPFEVTAPSAGSSASPADAEALKIRDLVKRYPTGTRRCKGVSLDVHAGEFFGLLGPNGAGKSTLIHCTTGLASPTSGSIEVFGHDAVHRSGDARAAVGLAPQDLNLDWFLTVEESLDYHGGYFGMSRRDRRDRVTRAARDVLAHGEARRAHPDAVGRHEAAADPRARADAPAAAADPRRADRRRRRRAAPRAVALRPAHAREGTTILLTTHYLEEAEQLCDRIAFIADGQIVAEGTSAALGRAVRRVGLEDAYLELVGRKELSRADRSRNDGRRRSGSSRSCGARSAGS